MEGPVSLYLRRLIARCVLLGFFKESASCLWRCHLVFALSAVEDHFLCLFQHTVVFLCSSSA